jgi:site-specific DNA recombinase
VCCQECGSRYVAVGRDYLACSAARSSGTCSNRQSIRRIVLERLILDGLRERLMSPELVEEFIQAFQKEINRQRREHDSLRDAKIRELADVKRKLNGLIEAIAEGFRAPGLPAAGRA